MRDVIYYNEKGEVVNAYTTTESPLYAQQLDGSWVRCPQKGFPEPIAPPSWAPKDLNKPPVADGPASRSSFPGPGPQNEPEYVARLERQLSELRLGQVDILGELGYILTQLKRITTPVSPFNSSNT